MSEIVHKTRVFFRWICGTKSDEEVRVVGSCPELGSWLPSAGVPLVASEKSRCWTSRSGIKLPLGRRVEYKYVIVRRDASADGAEEVQWEPYAGNRWVVPTGVRHVVEDDGGAFRGEDADEDRVSLVRSSPKNRWAGVKTPDAQSVLVSSPSFGISEDPQSPKLRRGLRKKRNDELTSADSVLIVLMELPLQVKRNEDTGEWEVAKTKASGPAAWGLHSFARKEATNSFIFKVRFVGTPGVFVEDKSEQQKIRDLLAKYSCIPVFVSQEVNRLHTAFTKTFLWPVFHNMKLFDTSNDGGYTSGLSFDDVQWKGFQSMNKTFSEVVEANGNSQALIWVHNYELITVPRFLFLRKPDWNVGLFLSSAFPSCEVMRSLPIREELIQAMLSCNIVTFQIFEYLRHFLSCVSILIGGNHNFNMHGVLQIEHDGRSIVVNVDHFVIPFDNLITRMQQDKVKAEAQAIRDRYRGKKIITSIDNPDRSAGLMLKLRSFSSFLQDYEQFRGRLVLVQYVLPHTGHGAQDVDELISLVNAEAAMINSDYQRERESPAVEIVVQDMDSDRRLASLLAADILLDTSINDGLNLTPFMFYAAHNDDNQGSVILSEFCGASSYLTGAYKVNPFNSPEVMEAMDNCLAQEAQDQVERFQRDHSYVATQSLLKWASQNVQELKAAQKMAAEPHLGLRGFGAGFQYVFMNRGFRHLNFEAVVNDYRRAKTRVFFLDNEGTLAAKAKVALQPRNADSGSVKIGQPPDPEVLDCLSALAKDKGNIVFIMSGRDQKFMDSWFSKYDRFGICAEHGFKWVLPPVLRPKTKSPSGAEVPEARRWYGDTEAVDFDDEWKTVVFELMQQYKKRVQGSTVEYKGSGITWNYQRVNAPSVVNPLALELRSFLDPSKPEGVMYGYPVKVQCGKGYLEVKRNDYDKGVAVSRVLDKVQQTLGQKIDFVLCIGDDRSDEDMFKVINDRCGVPRSRDDRSMPSEPTSPLGKDLLSPKGRCSPQATADGGARPTLRPADSNVSLCSEASMASGMAASLNRVELSLASDGFGSRARRERSNSDIDKGSGSALAGTEGTKVVRKVMLQDDRASPSRKASFYTVTVGRKPSEANYFVKDVDEVSSLLSKLSSQAVKISRYASMPQIAREEDLEDDLEYEVSGFGEPGPLQSFGQGMGGGLGGGMRATATAVGALTRSGA